jgi:uncharacterized membrane protein (UPF0127 family)
MEIGFFKNNKKLNLKVKKCGLFGMFRGLMFCRRENAKALLLLDFKESQRLKIHSLFVFFPFIAIWLDDKDKIIEIKKVNPWKFCVLPQKEFYKLIEIPCNRRYNNFIINLLSRR